MTEAGKCPNCGVTLPPNAPPGQCPACLLQIGLTLGGGDLLRAGVEAPLADGKNRTALVVSPCCELAPTPSV